MMTTTVQPEQKRRGDGGTGETIEGTTSVLHLRLQAVSLVAVNDEFGQLHVTRRHETSTAEPGSPIHSHWEVDKGVEHPTRAPVLRHRPSRHEQPADSERPLFGSDLIHGGQPLTEGAVDGCYPDGELLHVGEPAYGLHRRTGGLPKHGAGSEQADRTDVKPPEPLCRNPQARRRRLPRRSEVGEGLKDSPRFVSLGVRHRDTVPRRCYLRRRADVVSLDPSRRPPAKPVRGDSGAALPDPRTRSHQA